MSELLTVGIVGSSLKENEERVAIHPKHIERIPSILRKQMTFEESYGLKFGVNDQTIAQLTSGRVAPRKEILNSFDCVLIPKPLVSDLAQIREGTIVWAWTHCVQQKEITQISIDRKLTIIAWEEMFTWTNSGDKNMHIFYKNNEMAGYAGVNHALSLIGVAGHYGKSRKAVVLSFGSVSRGAIYALQGQGIQDITIYTNRVSTDVSNQLPGITFKQMKNNASGELCSVESDGTTLPFSEVLVDVDIIVNGILQNTEHPITFVLKKDEAKLKKGALIIDISCDEGMGFWCAKPTTFKHPIIESEGKFYYSVDHSPSYYWQSASWEISEAILPFLPIVIGGPKTWAKNAPISRAIEIKQGIIQNSKILSFQHRNKNYPHLVINRGIIKNPKMVSFQQKNESYPNLSQN
ncbi:N(5)-(carboxyethyl)ornithine synthase [Ancylomarina sp. 16SWW S1-10-2]|uniref:N(5)-(carboxyethyl)ornithine synthase n=1 Tax=Ancylomarina sp. 16SWW S1-10-2 TaxID=2499681 RepID=UPI0012AD35F2|nr:N(5)-(carboxyethyl)ornithine synthase [Ancylomarina sp. 16SWW S1-10-2]MRT94590.1 alanine dehydrogenase [Ancylomarina sp. 16SWW S1-10-2]